ncbi:hypothetical protein LAWI1_G004487 [Lachnellula willkommii]|uniref:Uncharacterized protein n=1 Tax=Lachnellula willkommii TaxID=215461 RepID=A0A559M419_9HELO|nr:hypothetical protein LAWI1_G004487 [Lachnellula willkommii]
MHSSPSSSRSASPEPSDTMQIFVKNVSGNTPAARGPQVRWLGRLCNGGSLVWSCKKESHDRNAAQLNAERTQVIKGI